MFFAEIWLPRAVEPSKLVVPKTSHLVNYNFTYCWAEVRKKNLAHENHLILLEIIHLTENISPPKQLNNSLQVQNLLSLRMTLSEN